MAWRRYPAPRPEHRHHAAMSTSTVRLPRASLLPFLAAGFDLEVSAYGPWLGAARVERAQWVSTCSQARPPFGARVPASRVQTF